MEFSLSPESCQIPKTDPDAGKSCRSDSDEPMFRSIFLDFRQNRLMEITSRPFGRNSVQTDLPLFSHPTAIQNVEKPVDAA